MDLYRTESRYYTLFDRAVIPRLDVYDAMRILLVRM